MLKPLLWIIAAAQLVLDALTLFAPLAFFGWMGLTVPAPDNGYMIGMLGARFLAYGVGMVMLARATQPSRFWIGNMALIQAVDLCLALVYVSAGLVPLAVAAFPATTAALFCAGLLWCLRATSLRSARAGTHGRGTLPLKSCAATLRVPGVFPSLPATG